MIAGAVVTLLFLLFPAPVFELGYYEREFSNEMYNEHLYLIVAVVTAVVAWGAAGIFYYVVNSVSFSRWYPWLLVRAVPRCWLRSSTIFIPATSSPTWLRLLGTAVQLLRVRLRGHGRVLRHRLVCHQVVEFQLPAHAHPGVGPAVGRRER
jgi:hypothetical protein